MHCNRTSDKSRDKAPRLVALRPTNAFGKFGLLLPLLLAHVDSTQAAPIAPSQLTPRSFVPPLAPRALAPLPSAEAPLAADSSAGYAISIGEVDLDGAFPELDGANATFVASIAHKQLTVGAMFDAARLLEEAYARRGYILVRVTIPPQPLSPAQPVHILVIDGFIETVDVGHVPPRARKAVAARLTALIDLGHVTEREIERRLLLAGDLAGVDLRSALARGVKVGGAKLVIEGTLTQFSGTVGADNNLPSSLGTWEWTANLAFNGILGLGDQTYVTAGSQLNMGRYGFPTSSFELAGGGLIVPIGTNGITLSGDEVYSRTQPRPTPGVPMTVGEFTRTQMRLGLPVIRARDETLEVSGTFSADRQTLRAPAFDAALNRDDYRALRLAFDWQRSALGAPASLSIAVSHGIDGRNGNAELPLSREGSSSNFTNVNATARIAKTLRGGTQFTLVMRGQEAFGKPQMLPEQFGLDAPDGVSAVPSGSFSVDDGVTLRTEISHEMPPAFLGFSVQPYLFVSQGWGWLEDASALERRAVSAHALGAGARFGAQGRPGGAFLSVELGFSGGRDRPDGARVSLTSTTRF